MIEFTIPKATPTLNLIKGMNRFTYKELRREFCWMVKAHCDIPSEPVEYCDIIITRYGQRLLDWDNCYGGIKPLMDCLVMPTSTSPDGLGVILDDNPKIVHSLTMHQVKVKKGEEATKVKILER